MPEYDRNGVLWAVHGAVSIIGVVVCDRIYSHISRGKDRFLDAHARREKRTKVVTKN
jgi:hypothetical protein